MANFMSTARISTGTHNKKNKFNMSCNTLTTSTFYALKPVYWQVVEPNEDFTIEMSNYTKLLPMIKPIMGNIRLVHRAFYVPYRQVMFGYDEYQAQTPFTKSTAGSYLIKTCTRFNNLALVDLFSTPSFGYVQEKSSGSTDYDFARAYPESSTEKLFKLTAKGRFAYDILVNLGYKVMMPTEDYNDPDFYMSAMALLSYAKIWYDWYRNPSYDNAHDLDAIFNSYPSSDGNGLILTATKLELIFDYCYQVQRDSDYFTSQWDNPNGPNNSNLSPKSSLIDISLPNKTDTNKSQVTNVDYGSGTLDGTPVVKVAGTHVSGTATNLSQYIIDSLKRLTDFVHRRQMVGNRTIDNFLALFGVNNPYEDINRSVMLGHWDNVISISEINATTESGTQALGDFAGKGQSGVSDMKFSFSAKEKGIIMVLSYIEPKYMYSEGINRYHFDLAPLDQYNGDFDHLGVQATFGAELWANQVNGVYSLSGEGYNKIIGYLPRYAHMKVPHDTLSGMFMRPLYRDQMQYWHLFRDISADILGTNSVPVHDYNFTVGQPDEFNRIFAVGGDTDNFISTFFFKVTMYSPKTELWNNYEFDHEEEHRQINMRVNGSIATD